MKKLNKLQINSEKLLKNEELTILRGGYGWGYCVRGGIDCGNLPTPDCGLGAVANCDNICPGWTSVVCFPR